MSLKYTFVVIATFAVYAVAITQEEKEALHKTLVPIIGKCSSEYSTSPEDIEAAKVAHSGDNLNSCFIGCFFKEFGVIDNQGLFDTDATNKKAKEFFNSEEDINKIHEITKICSLINAEAVSDGAKGCERAKLLTDCFVKNRGGFSPFS